MDAHRKGNPVIFKGSQNYGCNVSLTKTFHIVHTESVSLVKMFSRSFHDASVNHSSSCKEWQDESAGTRPGIQGVDPGSPDAPSAEATVSAPEWI